MITRAAIDERVREWGLREDVVEKDYALSWLLWAIGAEPRLSDTWVFKGGTCLKKCYIETYRFSEDLDFTILPGGLIRQDELLPVMNDVLRRVHEESGIDFNVQPLYLRTHPSGNYTEGRVYYKGPRNAPTAARIKLDLSSSEIVARPTVLRTITHAFPDILPEPAQVRCYSFEEVFAEKTRAMGERSRPRDLYDIINLYRRPDLGAAPDLIRSILADKCASKGVPIPTFESIAASRFRDELEQEWENMLAHQLPVLPLFANFWEELPNLFRWLEGVGTASELKSYPLGREEQAVSEWSPPPTVWTWGAGVPLETVRFAAANYLCIRLGYGGSTRIVEPYSLRRTQDGNLILHTIRVDNREHRAYRVDRIQSIEVTNQPFRPVYQVEFSSSGSIYAQPTSSVPRQANTSRLSYSSGTGVTVECPLCQKRFRRDHYDTKLNPHKNQYGRPCSGRRGFVV